LLDGPRLPAEGICFLDIKMPNQVIAAIEDLATLRPDRR
jgi:hypothetical protein